MPRRARILASLALLLMLALSTSCNPNPQPEALTPIPTLAPAAELALYPALAEPAAPAGEATPVPAPEVEVGDPAKGATLFTQNCAACHGENAAGGAVGPTLVSAELKAQSDDFFREVILKGRPGTTMPAWEGRLSAQDIEDVIAYLRSLQ